MDSLWSRLEAFVTLYLGKIPVGLMVQDNYFYVMLLAVSKKAMTQKWLQTNLPLRNDLITIVFLFFGFLGGNSLLTTFQQEKHVDTYLTTSQNQAHTEHLHKQKQKQTKTQKESDRDSKHTPIQMRINANW